ncbi:hypothetical protein [Fusobacterium ulcerans]|uniref:Uncharacterized protein n=1 Tax=Fusobacterium ulcerans 12-1B TaxID=457404 RepID=H1PQL1_9FUSO|nr:hypothetical protein [Fusobacterium ulcerans]EHO83686.1 hypothetical protein HMPREF0402_00704 [Fusobacterium ulcerans 12-1B]
MENKFILKKKTEKNFTVINNEILQDEGISWEARGIACFLLSKPEDWEISVTALSNIHGGRDKIRKIFTELINAGYMYKSQDRSKKGKFSSNIIYLSDCKEYLVTEIISKEVLQPLPEKPSTVKPLTVKTTQLITDINKELNKQKTTTTKKSSSSNEYDFLNNIPISTATKLNIRKNIDGLTLENFYEIFSKTEKEFANGKIENFEAVLYKALKGEWTFTITEKIVSEEQLRNKARKICNYWIASPYSANEKIENFLKDTADLPIEIIEEYKNKLIKFLKENGELIE